MAVSEQVIIEVLGRVDGLERELRRGGRSADRELSGIEARVRRFAGAISGLLAGVSAAVLVKEFLDLADTSKNLDAQLRLATAGFGSFAQAQEDVRRIAAATRAGLSETASLYGNFSRGAKELGADQEAAARATETFSKTLKISGADANQSASATLQFGQALAAGALRGDELNSVLEAAPRLARLLTESMGLPIGKIKELGEEGKLTSEVLLNALTNTKYTAGIDSEFRELPVTFSDAMTQVENAAIITFGGFDRGGQFSTALANFITDGSDGFKDLEQDAVEMGVAVRSSIEGLAGSFGPIFDEARSFFNFVKEQAGSDNLKFDVGRELRDLDNVTDWLSNRTYAGQKLKGFGVNIGRSDFEGRYRRTQAATEARLRGEMGERATNDIIGQYFDRFGNPVRAPSRATSAPAASGGSKSSANSAAAAARKAEQERLRAIREDASNARDAANLQDDINAARAALATATEDVLAYNLQSIDNEQRQRTAEYETQRKLGRISDQELADRTKAVAEIAALQRQRVQRIADENQRRDDLDRFNASVRDNSDLLRAQADLVTTREARRDIELRLLDLSYEQERAEQEAVLNSETASAAQKEIAEQRLRILDQLKGYDVERTNRQYEGPLAGYSRGLNETDVNDQVESYVVDELKSVQDSIGSGLQKAIGTDDPLISGLINLFIQQVIMKPIAAALAQATQGAGGGGIGGILGSIIGVAGAAFGGSSLSSSNISGAGSYDFSSFILDTNKWTMAGAPLSLAGARASGGPVSAGSTYLVGERGPELFTPGSSGSIVPNHVLGARAAASMAGVSAARPVQNTTIVSAPRFDLKGAVITPQLYADMQRISDESAARAGATSYKQSMKDAPGAVRRAQRFRTT